MNKKKREPLSVNSKIIRIVIREGTGIFWTSSHHPGEYDYRNRSCYESRCYLQRFFSFKKDGEWSDMNETAQLQLPAFMPHRFPYPIQLLSPTQITGCVLMKVDIFKLERSFKSRTEMKPGNILFPSKHFLRKMNFLLRQKFENDFVGIGSDLVMATARKYFGYYFRHSMLSLNKSAGLGESKYSAKSIISSEPMIHKNGKRFSIRNLGVAPGRKLKLSQSIFYNSIHLIRRK